MALERKLNPPQINNKIPAFIGLRQGDTGAPYQMVIPFNLNKQDLHTFRREVLV